MESTINQVVNNRFVTQQQMQWTPEGARLLVQTRILVSKGLYIETGVNSHEPVDIFPLVCETRG